MTVEILREEIKKNPLPKHVAVIMDGNGRWATERGLSRSKGHKEGMERVIELVEVSSQIGIESLTLFAFSTENWKRPQKEVDALMELLVIFVERELDRLTRNNVRLNIMGDRSVLPTKTKKAVDKSVERTKQNTGLLVNIALNYGGQTEIVRASKLLAEDYKSGRIKLDEITEDSFNQYLYTKGQPLPDLLIRPSGELRISNFMLYQIAYTEFYFNDILWPDFKEENFYDAILEYQKRNRRFGGLK